MTLQKKGGGLTSNDVAATLKGLAEIELQIGVHLFYWDFLDKNVRGIQLRLLKHCNNNNRGATDPYGF